MEDEEVVDPETPLKLVSQITEFNDLSEFMQDEQLDKALETVIKLMVKPNVPAAKAVPLIIELQAMSAKFAIMGKIYETVKAGPAKSDNAHKKNLYKNMNAALDKLVDALKYIPKQGYNG